jgi:hypothetical protein
MSIERKSNLTIKHTSTMNEIKDETFIISQSISNGIPLKLQRKIKSNEKFQKFIILEICNEKLQNEVERQFSEWKEQHKENTKMKQRDIVQSKQNIIYNVLISELQQKGNQIESYEQKKSHKVISRKRIFRYNEMNQEETRRIGEEMNKKIVELLPIENGKKKRECEKIIDSFHWENSISSSHLNENIQNEIQQNSSNEINEETIVEEKENQNEMNYIQFPLQTIQIENKQINIITINNVNYYCELINDFNGNLIPIIPIQNEDGNNNYYTVLFDISSYQFVMIPYYFPLI